MEGISYQKAKELYSLSAPGETGLRELDALKRVGADMTAEELADETGKKLSAIRVACRLLVKLGLLEEYRPGSRARKQYSLPTDVWQRLDAVAPHLRTYTLASQREDDRLVTAIQYARKELEKTSEAEDKERLNVRVAQLCEQRIPHLARLHEDMTSEEIEKFAYDVALPAGLHPAKQAKLDSLHATVKMDLAEAKHAEQWQATQTARRELADTAQAPTPVTVAPATGSVLAPTHRWQFVKDVAGVRRDLTRSAQGNDWKKEALYLAHYLDGNENDHTKAATAATMLGVYYQYGLDWQGMRSAVPAHMTR